MLQSLNARLLVAAGLVLAAFLSVAGIALDTAFRDTAASSVRERLTGRVYQVLGSLDLDDLNRELEAQNDALSTPESGYYAQIVDPNNKLLWHSASMLGITFEISQSHDIGNFHFNETLASTGEALFVLGYTILWEGGGLESQIFTIQVAETRAAFDSQVARFRQSLWVSFASLGLVLLILQTAILRWGLKPLRDVAREVTEIERGNQSSISGSYPRELRALTHNLNVLIRSSESSLKRYRNALGDLAHSLKTPLAVMRTTLEKDHSDDKNHDTLSSSIQQIDDTINYQLHRAAAAGRTGLATLVAVEPVVNQLVESLRKIYAARNLSIDSMVSPGSEFRGDRGDLMEMIGNVADNACKWAVGKVDIEVVTNTDGAQPFLEFAIRDDGPGIPESERDRVLQRGSRLDESTAGHGIGLSVVKELVVDVYGGKLSISPLDSGTEVRMVFATE